MITYNKLKRTVERGGIDLVLFHGLILVIFVEQSWKTTRNLKYDGRWLNQDSNPVPPEYKSEVSRFELKCLIK